MTYLQKVLSHMAGLTSRKAFTLIELSIVLVIIALIVGGILTGRDLIKASEIRATVAQIEKYNTAVNTFRNKYGGLPGDLLYTDAGKFGLFQMTHQSSCCGSGDGDGIISGYVGGLDGSPYMGGENMVFWRHLSDANLIDGTYAQVGTTPGTMDWSGLYLGVSVTASTLSMMYPPAKLGNGNYITPGYSGTHYFIIVGLNPSTIRTVSTPPTGVNSNNITAQEAYNIDKKVDDGLPGSGSVWGIDVTTATSANPFNLGAWVLTVSSQVNCVTGTSYNVSGNVQACSLAMKFN